MRLVIFTTILLLAACAGGPEFSDAEQRFVELANKRQKETQFPALKPLPGATDVVDGGIPEATAGELRSAASGLSSLTADVALPNAEPVSMDETVAELRAMIEQLRAEPKRPSALIEAQDIDFPTPPPLED